MAQNCELFFMSSKTFRVISYPAMWISDTLCSSNFLNEKKIHCVYPSILPVIWHKGMVTQHVEVQSSAPTHLKTKLFLMSPITKIITFELFGRTENNLESEVIFLIQNFHSNHGTTIQCECIHHKLNHDIPNIRVLRPHSLRILL